MRLNSGVVSGQVSQLAKVLRRRRGWRRVAVQCSRGVQRCDRRHAHSPVTPKGGLLRVRSLVIPLEEWQRGLDLSPWILQGGWHRGRAHSPSIPRKEGIAQGCRLLQPQ